MTDNELFELLDSEARRINSPDFIGEDPVQFPRRFERLPDIEIAALLSATIAWGRRNMICRNCERLLQLMDYAPTRFILDGGFEELPDDLNLHRTFFARNLKHYMRGLKRILERYGSVQGLAREARIGESEAPAWELARALRRELAEANSGECDSRCLPAADTSALKRLNMALRWLVRNDGIVDLGVWNVITPAQLRIPLDVHVADTSRQLGLLTRRGNDRKAVEELTGALRRFRPDDPVLYDYALFGIGMQL